MHWSLLIATDNRPDALRSCLQFAIAQSRPPTEIVIVDASDAWEAHRLMVLEDVAPRERRQASIGVTSALNRGD